MHDAKAVGHKRRIAQRRVACRIGAGYVEIAVSRRLVYENLPGQIVNLSAGPKTDLIAFHTGDQIIIEYNANYIIQSISKLGSV